MQPTPAAAPILQVGANGPDVAALKSSLASMHYAIDSGSTYTEQTRDAVIAFQKVNHLDRDGSVGPQVRAALADPRTPDIGTGAPERVIVDLSDQVLLLVSGGKLAEIVHASTGNPNLADGKGEATPQGTFAVQHKIAGRHEAPLGSLWWPSYFTGGVAVHGEPAVPTEPGSHGCVRVPMWIAKALYDDMPIGTQVTVRP